MVESTDEKSALFLCRSVDRPARGQRDEEREKKAEKKRERERRGGEVSSKGVKM